MEYLVWENIIGFWISKRRRWKKTAAILNKLLSVRDSIKIEDLLDNLEHENITVHNFHKSKTDIRNFIVFGAGPSLKKRHRKS